MLIKKRKSWQISENEVTPKHHYLNRRSFIRGAGAIAGTSLLAACRPDRPTEPGSAAIPTSLPDPQGAAPTTGDEAAALEPSVSQTTDELGNELTDLQDIISYNNFYEFSTDKGKVQPLSQDFVTSPWNVEVSGLVNNGGTFGLEELLSAFEQEERIYRLRCVEAWSMVIPWLGFPLRKLLEKVEPTSAAKFVKFTTLDDPDQFPGQGGAFNFYDWPYVEGLRLDEAMNDLTLMGTGIYGEPLLPQNGAPIRLVVPWKYGFKSIKSIVKIELVEEMPVSFWMDANAREYGFYSNVNPNVAHPRWSQATERRIGQFGRIDTLMFNGYEEEVASLYTGMDLRENF